MINILNKCGTFSNLKLSNYGSFCGLGWQGVTVDRLDQWCCYHERCYGQVMQEKCDGKVNIQDSFVLVHVKGSKAPRKGRLFILICLHRKVNLECSTLLFSGLPLLLQNNLRINMYRSAFICGVYCQNPNLTSTQHNGWVSHENDFANPTPPSHPPPHHRNFSGTSKRARELKFGTDTHQTNLIKIT